MLRKSAHSKEDKVRLPLIKSISKGVEHSFWVILHCSKSQIVLLLYQVYRNCAK